MKNNNYFIYKYTWPDGYVYIGKSRHGRKRYGNRSHYQKSYLVYNYWCKHGDPIKEIVEDHISEDNINNKEIYYISKYNSFHAKNPKGLNLTRGGDGGNIIGFMSEEEKTKMFSARTQMMRNRYGDNYYSEHQKEYYSIHPETKELISNTLKQKYSEDPIYKNRNAEHLKSLAKKGDEWNKIHQNSILRGSKNPNSRPCQCVETGEIFESATAAAKVHGGSYKVIWKCCHGDCKTAVGYHWIFVDKK